MANAPARVLTHHINIRNPETRKVETFEPQEGPNLPKWAHEALVAEGHAAYPESSARALALVRQWEASKLAAEALAVLRLGESDPEAAAEQGAPLLSRIQQHEQEG